MKTKTFKEISKGELKKYDGYKCDFITNNGNKVKNAEIYVEDDIIFILSNDKNANYNSNIKNKRGWKYVYIIYNWLECDSDIDNVSYNEITIYTEEEFKEGELIEVRNKDSKIWVKRIFLYKDKRGYYICVSNLFDKEYIEGKEYYTLVWGYARKIEKEIEIETKDGQTISITKRKAKELGFNV